MSTTPTSLLFLFSSDTNRLAWQSTVFALRCDPPVSTESCFHQQTSHVREEWRSRRPKKNRRGRRRRHNCYLITHLLSPSSSSPFTSGVISIITPGSVHPAIDPLTHLSILESGYTAPDPRERRFTVHSGPPRSVFLSALHLSPPPPARTSPHINGNTTNVGEFVSLFKLPVKWWENQQQNHPYVLNRSLAPAGSKTNQAHNMSVWWWATLSSNWHYLKSKRDF